MRIKASVPVASAVLSVILLLSLVLPIKPALAHPGKLMWSIVDTPSPENNVIVSPSEVNFIAIGSDGMTFYAVDIPNKRVLKSTDGGITWPQEVSRFLPSDALPVWSIALAHDDVNFVVAITDGSGVPNGPKRVFVSADGGTTWDDATGNLASELAGDEYIGCVDVSIEYEANKRDIAIGTRKGDGTGRVFVRQTPSLAGWKNQTVIPSTGWVAGDVLALEFSPNYYSDTSLAVVTVAGDTRLQLGQRDTDSNDTTWNVDGGYPVLVRDIAHTQASPSVVQVITADLELPSDFLGTDSGKRRYYVSTDVNTIAYPGVQSGVHRIDDNVVFWINPPITSPPPRRAAISSIAFLGNYDGGILLAGEVTADPATGKVCVWRTSAPTTSAPEWKKSDADYKSPTGGANSGFANTQVAWSPDGSRAYCGTSSANPMTGGTGWAGGQWPFAWMTGVQFDESAFSVSPYSLPYELSLVRARKPTDSDVGNVWNQPSLIDTQISRLSDVAVLETPEEMAEDYNILYLASCSTSHFDSLWRSTSDPLGRMWERILCINTANNDLILRVRQTPYEETTRSRAVTFADRGSDVVGYSKNEGQVWHVRPLETVSDLALAGDDVLFVLSDTVVCRYKWEANNWRKTHEVETYLDSGHTIAVPLRNPDNEIGGTADWVVVGEGGPPTGSSRVAYADFSTIPVRFEPSVERRVQTPVLGDVHVIADDRFERNRIIYAGVCDTVSGASGKIYRWVIGQSTVWDELEPPNEAFYGLAQRNDVLYGAWDSPGPPRPPEPANNPPGVDRTLYARASVPPPTEWDDLTVGLPVPGEGNYPVAFTREPSSLKVSSNEYNNLWAIDDRPYDWMNRIGCLWTYTDTAAKVGPWTAAPPSGELIPVDPVSGRAREVNFRWRQLSYASVYELQIAKDRDFTILVLLSDNITPVDQLSPACFFPSGGLVPHPESGIADWGSLESGHTYYWRVRARGAVTGEIVRSPWSATMYFMVKAGLPVKNRYGSITLLSPADGARDVSRSPTFAWSPVPGATSYEFTLAKDASLSQLVVKARVSTTTAYIYGDRLDWNATYFWQVRAIEPVVGDPSLVGSFRVMSQPEIAAAAAGQPPETPCWVWVLMAIYIGEIMAIIALAIMRSKYARFLPSSDGGAESQG